MMNSSNNSVAITIMGRTYQIKCPPEETVRLHEAAKQVDMQMRKMSQSAQVGNTERLLIITALNIAYELLMHKNQNNTCIDAMHVQVKSLQHRIQKFLNLTDVSDVNAMKSTQEEMV